MHYISALLRKGRWGRLYEKVCWFEEGGKLTTWASLFLLIWCCHYTEKIKAIRNISLPRRLSIEIQNCGMSNAHTKLCHESCSILVDMTLLCELNHQWLLTWIKIYQRSMKYPIHLPHSNTFTLTISAGRSFSHTPNEELSDLWALIPVSTFVPICAKSVCQESRGGVVKAHQKGFFQPGWIMNILVWWHQTIV